MTEQKNSAPWPLSDEELEAATGGAVGINPALLYAAGAQGMYMPTAEPLPPPSGSNPLYVALAEPYVPPALPQAHTPAPQSAPAPQAEPTTAAPLPSPEQLQQMSTILTNLGNVQRDINRTLAQVQGSST